MWFNIDNKKLKRKIKSNKYFDKGYFEKGGNNFKMKKTNLIIVLLIMILSMFLITTTTVYADNEREVIENVIAESNITSTISYGDKVKKPEITITDGYPAFFYTAMGKWQKKNGEAWNDAGENDVFRAGTWRYKCQIMIEDNNEYGNVTELYQLANKIRVFVDNVEWTNVDDTNYNNQTNESTAWVYSNEMELPESENLIAFDLNKYKIGSSVAGVPLEKFSVEPAIEGGTRPYTFEKKSGPEWIVVSSNGEISGTPIKDGTNDNVTILVTDNANRELEFELSVENTEINLNNREIISKITATSDDIDNIPEFAKNISKPTITVQSGIPAYFSSTEGVWQKKKQVNGEWNWENEENGLFEEGIWRYKGKIVIDNKGNPPDAGDKYKLSNEVMVEVNNETWTSEKTKYVDAVHRSYAEVYSKEYFVAESGRAVVSFESNGGSLVDKTIIDQGTKLDKPYDPTRNGYVFDGWYKDKELKNRFDFEKDVIMSHTTLYAKWLKIYNITAKTSLDGTDSERGSIEGIAPINKEGDILTLKAIVDNGYYFECWKEDGKILSTDITYKFTVNRDRNIKAIVHRLIKYEVKFETDGGTNIPSQNVWNNNPYVIKPADPKKEGCDFTGWYLNDKIFDFKNTKINQSVTIYAKWHKHTTINVAAKAATCKQEGNTAYFKCNICNKIFKDANGTQEIALLSTVIPKIAHQPKDEFVSKEKTKATLKKNGKIVRKYQTKCRACGDILGTKTKTEKIYYAKTIKLSKTTFKYNKKVQTPTVIIKDSKGNVIDEENYTLTYSNKKSKKVGEYKITIKFKNKYKGTKELKYIIKPQGTTLKKLSAGEEQFKAKWSKNTDQTSGYQIQYSTNSKFSKNSSKELIEDNKKTSQKFKDLKAKKKYYVRIRTYKNVNEKRFYSSWSESKTVKTKKVKKQS